MIREQNQASGLRGRRSGGPGVVPLHPGSAGPRARVIAVTSGKGGVGKTQVASNLAVGLARQGKRVLMLDGDLGLASLDLALGVNPQHTLLNVLTGERSIDEIVVEGPAGVHLIPACHGRYDVANLDASQHARLWEQVEETAQDFDFLVVDTGAGIGSNAVGFASCADDVLMVTTPDPTALRDAYAMAKVLHRRHGVNMIHIVANQVVNEREGAEIHARMDAIIGRFLSLELSYLGAIPRDEAVRESVAMGTPFALRSPNSMAGKAMLNMVHRVMRMEKDGVHPC